MNVSGPLVDGRVRLAPQLRSMRALGTQSFRLPVNWADVEPYAKWSEVPATRRGQFVSVDGRPATFVALDREMLAGAEARLRAVPVIVTAPAWGRVDPARQWSPPAHPAQYGAFVGTLVKRYGARGTFWIRHTALRAFAPRWWQIWNEPAGGEGPRSSSFFWDDPRPYEQRYLAMLRASRRAIRSADPTARVLLGGLWGKSWLSLADIYAAGGHGLFDGVAIHPYADSPGHVLTILRLARRVMAAHGDRRLPLLATEMGWNSSWGHVAGRFGIATTQRLQAKNLAGLYTLLAAHRRELRLAAVYWFTWLGAQPNVDPWGYAGLLRLEPDGKIVRKPAYGAYRAVLRRLGE